MASGRLFLPGWMPARDSNGDPIPNVSVSFYQNETDVLASVYADDALTVPLTNPVSANSSGRFPQIYASDAITYSASVEAPYGPAGQPFTFDGLEASQAADIAAANLAQGAAEDAEDARDATIAAIANAQFYAYPEATAFDIIPTRFHNAISNRTSTIDVGGYIQEGLEKYGAIRLNAGKFLTSTTIEATNNHQTLIGTGRGVSELRAIGSGAFDLIRAEDVTDFVVSDMTLSGAGVAADGKVAIRFKNSHSVTARSFRTTGAFRDQIVFEGGVNQYIYFLDEYSLEASCIEGIVVGRTGGVVQELFLGDGSVVGGSVSALGLYDASGIYPGTMSLLGGGRGLVVNPGAGQVVRYVQGGRIISDSTTSETTLITTAGGVVESWDTELWASSSSAEGGMVINQGSGLIDNLKLDVMAINNFKSGLLVGPSSNIEIHAQIGRNSRSGSAAFENIAVDGGKKVKISGIAANVGSSTFTELASYAVRVLAGSEDVTLDNLSMTGCVTGEYTDAGLRTVLGWTAQTAVRPYGSISSNIASMASAKGFVRFSEGQLTLNANAALPASVFEGGGSVVVPTGVTLTINERINAPRMQIFFGTGTIILNDEASHFVYPEWFGVFPNRPAVDASLGFQKISDSVVASRECLIDVGPGTYYLQTAVSWSRGCRVLGAGDRIAHFRTSFTTGDVFTCAAQGVQFENIQFSCSSKRTSGAYINLNSQYSSARRIWATEGFEGVTVNAGQCKVDEVTGSVWSNATDSAIVSRKAGDDADVSNIQSLGSGTDAPFRVVSLKPSAAAVRYGKIDNVRGAGAGVALVEVHAGDFDVEYVKVTGVTGKGSTGNGVVLRSTNGNMRSCSASEVDVNAIAGAGILVAKDSAGAMTSITIGRHDLRATGDGIRVEATTGTVQGVSIGAGIARNCGANGYNLKAVGLAAVGIQARSCTGTGVLLQSGAATYHIIGVAEFNGTNVTHPAEANSVCTVVVP